jgi:hypothetical protein
MVKIILNAGGRVLSKASFAPFSHKVLMYCVTATMRHRVIVARVFVQTSCRKPRSVAGGLWTVNLERGFFRIWLIIMVIGLSLLACYTFCDGNYIKHYYVSLLMLTAGAALWALCGFRA